MTDRSLKAIFNKQAIDLSNCDDEPVHIIGDVQPHAALIATRPDGRIAYYSQNAADVLGLKVTTLSNLTLDDIFDVPTTKALRDGAASKPPEQKTARLFALNIGKVFDISIFETGDCQVFEFEPKVVDQSRDDLSMVQPYLAQFQSDDCIPTATQAAARAVQSVTGFDRVMVYRFAHDNSGEVIAEVCDPEMEPFLGLRYPATDIPKQARALLLVNPLRVFADVTAKPVDILAVADMAEIPLDLSASAVRGHSRLHTEYLSNMGVGATMTASLVCDGKLWGMIACHHRTPQYIDFERRSAVELYAQVFSYHLSRKLEQEVRHDGDRSRALYNDLLLEGPALPDLHELFPELAQRVSEFIAFDGIALYSEGKYVAHGATPTAQEFEDLHAHLRPKSPSTIYATSCLSDTYPAAKDMEQSVAGILAICVSREPQDYVVLCRKELVETVTWAGNPDKSHDKTIRLSPRQSFAAWQQTVHNTSALWTDRDQQAAESLRITLTEVIVRRLTDKISEERLNANAKQSTLIGELNHRVRNILNLIRGMVSQSRASADGITDYSQILNGRIQALARAHDQLTSKTWASVSLRTLIEIEASAFDITSESRFTITGPDRTLTPDAFTSMALVVHELVTNALKYGALSVPEGKVDVTLTVLPDQSLEVLWLESGGPEVVKPTRTGFGSNIIQRAIPFELNGTAELYFEAAGVQVRLTMIPDTFVDDANTASPTAIQRSLNEPTIQMVGAALVVEDNLIIGMDTQDMMAEIGADPVHLASNAAEALDIIRQSNIKMAVLDVNLGDHTSETVANELRALGVPYILATGFGDTLGANQDIVITKPFRIQDMRRALEKAGVTPIAPLSAHLL